MNNAEQNQTTISCECGAEVLPNDNFCHACGSSFSGEVEEHDETQEETDHHEEEGDRPEEETEEESTQPQEQQG